MQTADVVVVGAGVNGLSTAFHLARAGVKRVVVVEQRHLAAGATGKSGALVRMHYTNEPETRLAFESLKYFQNWSDMVGDPRRLRAGVGLRRSKRDRVQLRPSLAHSSSSFP
jgi:sarcosine oxidase, subunit beta